MSLKLITGDVLRCLAKLPDESVQCVVTSPPYWGLRDYGVSGQIGLEPTPEAFVAKMVAVFREVKRVLRPDGVCFINLGDSYMGGGPHHGEKNLGKSGTNRGSVSGVDRVGARNGAAYGTSDKAPEDSPNRGCLCGSLCDACRVAYQTGKAHSGLRLDPRLVASPSEPNRERKESGFVHPPTSDSVRQANRNGDAKQHLEPKPALANGRLHASLHPKSRESSQQSQAVCSPADVSASCLLCGRSLASDAHQSEHRTEHPCGIQPAFSSTQDQGKSTPDRVSTGDACCCHIGDKACGLSYPDYTSNVIANKLKHKDLCGIPWRVAFALQADGWYLRSDIVWHKPNPMPESVRDRPTKAHEYVFLLTKRSRYYYDAEAVKEKAVHAGEFRVTTAKSFAGQATSRGIRPSGNAVPGSVVHIGESRNSRSVWTITPKPFEGAHFATFPPALVERCVKAGTSERGACPTCGAPWERVTERETVRPVDYHGKNGDMEPNHSARRMLASVHARRLNGEPHDNPFPSPQTLGWRPTCSCPDAEPVPCTVLDPFSGAGTVALVCEQLGRDAIGIDLNPAYNRMARRRIAACPRPA